MRFVQPAVFLTGKTTVQYDEVDKWLRFIDAEQYADSVKREDFTTSTIYSCDEGSDRYTRYRNLNTTDAERLVQLAGKRCYMSFQVGLNPNIQRIRQDMTEFIDNILRVQHGSILEHASFNFNIENVSRVFTGELNRHRAGVAISEGSMRFIRFNDIPIVEVPSITLCSDDTEEMRLKKTLTRESIRRSVETAEEEYTTLCQIWKDELSPESTFKDKKHITSMLRRIVPMGVATGGMWTFNLRSLRHVCTIRSNQAAEEEILQVVSIILEKMIESEPIFFNDFYKDESGFWTCKYQKV